MKRRDFTTTLASAGLGCAFAGSARAQGAPVEGTHYVRLAVPAVVSAPTGKIEVIEFFWYGCPHCNALEPALDDWVKRLPADVAFKRVHVAFSAVHEAHQRLFYGLESMGQLGALHKRIFAALHAQQPLRLEKEADQVAFLNANGVDGAKFVETVKSFGVQTKMRQAKQLSAAYKIDGVPAIGIHGRYYTAGSLAGDNRRALAVADYLVQQVRKAA